MDEGFFAKSKKILEVMIYVFQEREQHKLSFKVSYSNKIKVRLLNNVN